MTFIASRSCQNLVSLDKTHYNVVHPYLYQCKTSLYTFSIFLTNNIMFMCGQKWLMSPNCINNYSITSYLWHVQSVAKYTCKSIECLHVCKFSIFELTYTYMYDSNCVYVICILVTMCKGDYLIKKSLMRLIHYHGIQLSNPT